MAPVGFLSFNRVSLGKKPSWLGRNLRSSAKRIVEPRRQTGGHEGLADFMAGADENLIGRRHELLDDFALFVPQLNAEILTAIAERVIGEFIGLGTEAGEDLIEPAPL